MTYDPTVPAPTQRISDTQSPIQTNFQFIESGDSSFKPQQVNYDNRTQLVVSNDPTAIPNSYILYCKEDSGANRELFGIDVNSVISQFTSTDFTLTTNGHAVIPPGFLMNWGQATLPNGGSLISVVFTRAFSANPFVITVTPYVNPTPGAGANSREIGADNFSTTGFDARLFNGNTTQATLVGWMAIGLT